MSKRAALLFVLTSFGVLLWTSPALAAPSVVPSTGQLEFGDVDLHYGGSPHQSVSFLQMDPLGSTLIESATVVGAEASNFQIVSDGCSGNFLEMSKDCSVEVAFESRGEKGVHSAALELVTAEGPVEVALSGNAITGTLSASPDPLTFSALPFTPPGSHTEGEYSETEPVTIQNSANASTQVQSASITGPDASSFSIQWNCNGNTLGTNNSCNVGIQFKPTSLGVQNATLVIGSDSASSPLEVPLSGEGLHGPQMTLNTTQALLGDVALGSSAEQTFDITNTGDYPLQIQRAFLVSGTPLMFPVLADSCSGEILYPTESCAITIGFRPTTLGEKDASMLFITNTPAINVAGVDGVGVAAEPSPAISMPEAPASTPASPAASPPRAPVPAPAVETAPAPTPPAPLSARRQPRLFKLLGRTTLDPGVDVQCPSSVRACEVLSFAIPSHASRTTAPGFSSTSALLGSALIKLRAGQGVHVRVPLSARAAARLKRRGHIRLRVGVVVQAHGAILAQEVWTIKLTSSGVVSRIS